MNKHVSSSTWLGIPSGRRSGKSWTIQPVITTGRAAFRLPTAILKSRSGSTRARVRPCKSAIWTSSVIGLNSAPITRMFSGCRTEALDRNKSPNNSMKYFHFTPELLIAMSVGSLSGQPAAAPNSAAVPEPLNWTTQQDHQNMKDQLGIKTLRPGPSGRAGATNAANYDPAKANPFPDLPDPLTLKNGHEVKTAEMWWKQRRPEIVEDFEREVIGRVPRNVPKVTWTVVSNIVDGLVGNLPANGKRLIGHVDNSACPLITVDIRMTLVTPAKAKGPAPESRASSECQR